MNSNSQLLVLAILFGLSDSRNPFLDSLKWSRLNSTKAGESLLLDLIDVQSALPKMREYFTFAGSLTTPPCTEGVTWVVLGTAVPISPDQVAEFPSRNFRPPQPLYNRQVSFLSNALPAAATPWGYEDNNGPSKWVTMGQAGCGGKEQSPVNIEPSKASKNTLNKLVIKYSSFSASALNIRNVGHTFQVDIPKGPYVTFEDRQYNLLQFHFHRGSETQIDGKQFALEVHFVHMSESQNYLVLSILFDSGAENQALKTIGFTEANFKAIGSMGAWTAITQAFDPSSLIPKLDGGYTVPDAFNSNHTLWTTQNDCPQWPPSVKALGRLSYVPVLVCASHECQISFEQVLQLRRFIDHPSVH
jgi:carbonic anhydrase